MTSTGHQDSPTGTMPIQNMSSHQANLMGAQQRQQQELIKLIAQHFHNQFYQLANNPTNGPQAAQQQQQQLSRSRLSSTTGQFTSHQQQHFQNLPGFPMNGARPLDLNTMNHLLATSQAQHQHFLPNHLLRSQQINSMASNGTIGGLGVPDPSCMNFPGLPAGLTTGSYPSVVDLSLFNALGLNLINSQVNNSPTQRQPTSLGHNNIGRQYSEGSNLDVDRPRDISNRGQKNNIGNSSELDVDQQDGRELLKFSINTILGRGSPKSASPMNEDSRVVRSYNRSNDDNDDDDDVADDSKDNCDQNLESKMSKANKDQVDQQLRVSECDLASEYNGSPSSSANSTPIPQTSGISSSHSAKLPFSNHQPRLTASSSDQFSANSYQAGSHFISSGLAGVQRPGQPGQPGQQLSCHPPPPPPMFLTSSNAFPWTVAARGKPRRGMMRRAVFSDSQRVGLEKRFQLQKYISKPDRKKLAEKLGLRDSQVKIWFQNRRMKWRNSKERELLSAGGSREQTLPTRNNPNPDLSDVGETVKRLTSAIGGPSSNNSQSK